METDRGKGNMRGGGRGRNWRGPYRGKGNRGGKQNSFERDNILHMANVPGMNPFLQPNLIGEDRSLNPGLRYQEYPSPAFNPQVPPPQIEPQGPMNFPHPQRPNPNFPTPAGQKSSTGARRRETRNKGTRTMQHTSHAFIPQFHPLQGQPYPNQEPLNFPDTRGHNTFIPKQFQRMEKRSQHFNQNASKCHPEGLMRANKNQEFQQNYDMNQYHPRFTLSKPINCDQGSSGINSGFKVLRQSTLNFETNLNHGQSMESLNSERSLNLQDHCSKRGNKTPRQKRNKLQKDVNNPIGKDWSLSSDNRPLSRSSTNSNDFSNDVEDVDHPIGSSFNEHKRPPIFRGRGRAERHNTNTSNQSNLLNDHENLYSPTVMNNLSKKIKNNRREKGPNFIRPRIDQNEECESRSQSRSLSCSSEQYHFRNPELDTLSDEENVNKEEFVKNVNIERGRHQERGKSRQSKEKNKNKVQHKPEQQKSILTADQLDKLKQYDPLEIVQILSEHENEYSLILKEDHDSKIFISVVEILSKVCKTPDSQSKAEILRQASLPTFTSQLFNCITEYPYLEDDYMLQYVNQCFENVILIYETLSDFMPSAIRMWHNHTAEVHKSLKVMTKNSKIQLNPNLLNMVKNLLDEIGQNLKKEVKETKVQDHDKKQETYFPEPVGNFRTVSLYPRPEDVYSEQPFLYPNIIKGPYRSVEHYLDTHFKLLREDFMSPIRQAMRDYKKKCNTKDRFKRVDNVRIYRKVKFLHPKTVLDTVGYEVCFDVDKKLQKVNWEFSSRFMYGSLLFFTNDDFDSFFMATVANRNVKDLEQKLVTVELVEHLGNMKSILGKEFIMAESEAYFNPYFHVLKALQRLDETNFPLAKYIVSVNAETNPPVYLNFPEIYSITMAGNNFTFRVLSDFEWPTNEQLGLDRSQYGAFKAALTNDLTVIQGPPGTGKTFLGLKIAQALLENAHVWNDTSTPIFVVCFTNHALDQFLEGLLPITTKLVRIGGKSKGSELDKFNIRERRREYNYYKKVQGKEIRELKTKMSTVFADIQVYQSNLKALENTAGVISVKTLQLVMSEENRDYFSGDEDFLDWLLEGVAGAKNKEQVKITITADRGIVRKAPSCDPNTADAEDWRVKQAFFDTLDLDTTVGPSEDTVTVQFACDLDGVVKKQEDLRKLLNVKKPIHRNQLLQARRTLESLDLLLTHLRKELIECKKLPRSDLEKKNLFHYRYLRNLKPDDRWRLYHTWANILREGLVVELGTKDAEYKGFSFRYEQLRQNDDLQILKTANVVGTTTTLAAKFQPMFEALAPKIVIVEEAAEVLEAHIVASLSRSCEHLILIGDHKQLRPNVAENRMARQYQLDVSLFERLVINDMACHTLTLQHRMRPEISRQLVPTIYPVLRDDPSVLGRDNIRGMDKNVFFLTHNNFEDEVTEITSKRNRFEAEILLGLARYLVQQGYKPQEITILATYKGQMYHMKNEINKISGFPRGIQITVVDNFQGEENKIILLSLVRSNAVNKIGFLEIENRICVALSRARDGLYIVGNMGCLVSNSEIWVKIRRSLIQQQAIGPSLNLCCQIHKDQITSISSGKDFSKVSEGGCSLLCGQLLSCGHLCKSMCHVEQDYHKQYKCKEPCTKILCGEGHQCPKRCHQECGLCQIPMRRQLNCGHYANVPCHLDVREHPCSEPVQMVMPFCKHTVTIPCHTRFHPECNLPCTKRLECGHSCELPCHELDDPDHLDYACMKPCARLNKDCSMDHKCKLACFEECKPCTEMGIRELPCGHSLKLICSVDVRTVVCQQKCKETLACGHPCSKKCFQDCQPCMVLVKKKVPICGHEMEVACSTAATRQICQGRCSNILSCSHQCGKRCMDTCSSEACESPVTIKEKAPRFTLFTDRKKQFPMLCGHTEAQVPCNKVKLVDQMKPQELMDYCCQPCGTVLTCTHTCSGTCSQCMQGRIHKVCNEQCGNILICGHSCKVPCREVCPPCKEPCRHECKHSKCNRKCGEVCVPCQEPCDYACQHLQCSRRCGELCNREPCYEPCLKRLDCGHSCVGFCGEPCPPCRKCEPEHFEEIFFTGEETEEDAKWVKLVDCGHTVESTGMEMWINMEQESGEIGCKVCPRCKSPIVKVQRFMNLIKLTYLDIQKVKAQCFGKRDKIKKERAQALLKIQNVAFIPMSTDKDPDDKLQEMFIELKNELPEVKGQKRNNIDAQKLSVLCFWTEFFISVYTRKQEVWSMLDGESKCLLNEKINSLTKLLMKRRQKISKQEMVSFEREVKRIHRVADLLVYTSSTEYRMASSFSGAKDTRLAAESIVFSVTTYNEEQDKEVKILLEKLKKQIKSATELTAEERSMINKAMSSSFSSIQKSGHWFKCKNGHLYCITECGGAMQEAQCPIRGCGEMIGGRQHRLRNDQSLASEMDGARHAAWSDANNMENYNFF